MNLSGINYTYRCCLQYTPVYKDISKSMEIVDKFLEKYTTDDQIDVLILPEMAFTGYKFDNRDDIHPKIDPNNQEQSSKIT